MTRWFLPALLALLFLSPAAAQTVEALLVPDSINKRILRLDPVTGDVLDAAWAEDARFGTIIHAIGGFDGDGVLVSDQIADVVWRVSGTGDVLGVFAPAGGANPDVLDNIRGIALSSDGERLFVTVASGAHANSVLAFDRDGVLVDTLVAAGANGLDSPWSLVQREADLLVAASGTRAVLRYTPDGTPVDTFATIATFPQQASPTATGGLLVANFSPVASRGIYEYDADGALLRTIQLGAFEGAPRGVTELPDGTVLMATSAGVYQVDRAGTLLSTKVTGGQYRFFGRALLPPPVASEVPAAPVRRVLESVAPNPTAGTARVTVDLPDALALRVVVLDARGREVARLHDGPAPAGRLTFEVEAGTLPPGVYTVRVSGADIGESTRFVVVR